MIHPKSKYNYISVRESQVSTYIEPQSQSQHDTKHGAYTRKPGAWRPLSLRLPFLITFALALLCVVPALLVIRQYADEHGGFTLITLNHYTWTYGPTAVFIIIVSLWKLLDYNCKSLTAWAELANGPVGADQSILLDHLTPLLPIIIFNAFKYRHYVVVLTTASLLILQLVIVFSTGLFFTSFVTVRLSDIDMIKVTRFDNLTHFSNYGDPGQAPFYKTYAAISRNYTLPEGVTKSFAFESIRPIVKSGSPNTTYHGVTGAFIPQITCNHVQTNITIDDSQYTDQPNEVLLPIQIPHDSVWTCPQPFTPGTNNITINSLPIAAEVCPPRQIITSFGIENCSHTGKSSQNNAWPLFIALSDVLYNQTFDVPLDNYTYGDLLSPANWSLTIPTTQAMLCQVSYSIGSVPVTYDMSTSTPVIETGSVSASTQQLDYLSNEDLVEMLAYVGASHMLGVAPDAMYEFAEQPPQTVTELMAKRVDGDYEYLMNNPDTMLQAAEDVLTLLAVFIAEDVATHTTNSTFQGDTLLGAKEYTEERLQVQPESLFLMLGGIIMVVLFAIGVVFLRPTPISSENPLSTGAIAQVLQNSPDVQQQLLQMSRVNEDIGGEQLRQHKFYTPISRGEISLCRSTPLESSPISNVEWSSTKYYSPLTTRTFFLLLTLLLTSGVIALLQILQHISDTSDAGIASFKNQGSFVITIYTRYLPAAVMFVVATLFGSFSTNILIHAPYSKMYAGVASYDALIQPLIGQIPVVALFSAYKNRYWGALLAGFAGIIGAFLSIIVSGLYSIQTIPQSTGAALYALDSFNLSYHQGLATDNATAATVSLIESELLVFPEFTYDELVFPMLSLSRSEPSNNSTLAGVLVAQIPALRADLSCTALDSTVFNYTLVHSSTYNYTQVMFNGTVPLPKNCQKGTWNGEETSVKWTNNDIFLDQSTNTTYIAFFVDMHVGPYDKTQGMDFDEAYPNQPDNPPGCPNVLLVYGYFDGNNDSNSILTAQLCDQNVHKVQSTVNFAVPEMSIASSKPPIVDESTVELLPSGPNNTTAFWWRLESALMSSFQILNSTQINPNTSPGVSTFFQGVLFGKTPLPLDALAAGLKTTTYTPNQLFEHIQAFYRRYMAQYISANMRASPATPADPNALMINTEPVQGSFFPSTGTPIMVQNSLPKYILQFILATMVICSAFAWYLTDYHNIVPWNPCTIAGVMVLLAGSKMCKPGADNNSLYGGENSSASASFDGLKTAQHEESSIVEPEISMPEDAEDIPLKSFLNKSVTVSGGRNLLSSRFRMGWWKDNVYVGPKRPQGVQFESELGGQASKLLSHSENKASLGKSKYESWRYGIDKI